MPHLVYVTGWAPSCGPVLAVVFLAGLPLGAAYLRCLEVVVGVGEIQFAVTAR